MDPSTLHATLMQTRIDQMSIQKSAAGMMSHYGGAPSVAVNEWRECLESGNVDQLLPLLYVANEVLQTSKRNRGNQFLEAFSSVLGKALQMICQRLHRECSNINDGIAKVEKARRVVKIWCDRHVFSVRFVTEILGGVEMYRKPSAQPPSVTGSRSPALPSPSATPQTAIPPSDQDSSKSDRRSPARTGSASKSSFFGSPAGESLLRVDLGSIESPSLKRKRVSSSSKVADVSPTADASEGDTEKSNGSSYGNLDLGGGEDGERRGSSSASKKKNKTTALSVVDILNELEDINIQYRSLKRKIDTKVTSNSDILEATSTELENLVGDELSDKYQKVVAFESFLKSSPILHQMRHVAQRRYELEQLLVLKINPLRYVTLKQDEEDLKQSEHILEQLELLLDVHAMAKAARERQLAEEKEQQEMMASEKLAKQQEEAQRQALQEALAKPKQEMGMVWNPVTREFQPATDATQGESWREH